MVTKVGKIYLSFKTYQRMAEKTARFTGKTRKRVVVAALGVAGEAGEVADIIKKVVGHGHKLDLPKLKDELGDVLWYIAELSSALGLDLEDVAFHNVTKLKQRYPKGFSSEASKKNAARRASS